MPAPVFTRPIVGSVVSSEADQAALNATLAELWTAIASGADEAVIDDLVATLTGLRADAQAAASAAEAAQGLAEAARDSSFVNAKADTTIALARARVADGETFLVIASPTATQATAYRRESSSTQTLLGSFPTAALDDLVRFERFITAYPKIDARLGIGSSTATNGASFWDGAETAASASAGGIFIPAGETGHQSFIRYRYPFTADVSARLAGRRVRFVLPVVTSPGLLTAIPNFSNIVQGQPTQGTFSGMKLQRITDTFAIWSFEYVFVGTETLVTGAFQVNNPSNVFGVDHHWHVASAWYLPLDANGFSDVIADYIAASLAKTEAELAADLLPKVRLPLVGSNLTNGLFNGAVLNTPGDLLSGFTIPAGQTGFQTFYSAVANLGHGRALSLAGRTVRFALELETSENALDQRNFDVSTNVQRVTGTTADLGTFSNSRLIQMTPTRALAVTDFTFTGVEQNVNVTIQQTGNSVRTGAECSIKPVSAYHVVLGDRGFQDAVRENLPTDGVEYIRTVVIKPDGTGDFVSLKAAIDALGVTAQGSGGSGSNSNRRVLYLVHEGVYEDIEYFLPRFADIVGIGRQGHVWLKGYQPPDTSLTNITNNSTVWMNDTTRLFNLKITAQNMRYPIHSDSGPSARRAIMEIYDCHIEHFGNDEARAWQSANGGNAAAVHRPEHAWGGGTHSGQKIISKRTKWISGRASSAVPFSNHTNRDFPEGNLIELEDCELTHPLGNRAYQFDENGSKVEHHSVLKNCVINGEIINRSTGWLNPGPEVDHGNGSGMCRITVSGGTPTSWTSTNNTEVLELRSEPGADSAVAISGDAADVLFGPLPDYRAGGTNYAARVFSSHKINLLAAHSLGTRLGDRSGTPITLTVALDGGSPVDLVLNADYTAMNNAAVITALNSLMTGAGGGATFAQVDPYGNTAPVVQTDHEIAIENTSADTVILKGMVVAYDGARHLGRIATSADARHLIAGIALENIAPGERGRVLKSGHIAQSQVLFSAAPTMTFGAEFGVGATAGQIASGASMPLLRAIRASVLEIL